MKNYAWLFFSFLCSVALLFYLIGVIFSEDVPVFAVGLSVGITYCTLFRDKE